MKLSEKWLRQWVNSALSREALSHCLTMGGLSIESVEPYEDDFIFEFELTPNRGDCLSVQGIAREVSILTHTPLHIPFSMRDVRLSAQKSHVLPINIKTPQHCPYYTGRVIKNFPLNKETPAFIKEILQKSDIKIIHPIVDVMNYVMLELGQPLHAFDLHKLDQEIIVRKAKKNEELLLLDGKKVNLNEDTLVIADHKKLLAIAGIMGGLDSAVDENTTAIFIESAFFTPEVIAGRARRYALSSDASHRFERGVDPTLAKKALERATELLLHIDKNLEISEILEKNNPKFLPKQKKIKFHFSSVEKRLGISLSASKIKKILFDLEFSIVMESKNAVTVVAPSFRFDVSSEIDLIEEIARIYGYDNIPAKENLLPLKINPVLESQVSVADLKKKLVHQGYQEVITYSFISEKLHQLFDPEVTPIKLSNPLSSALAVMRSNLWASLTEVVSYNLARQKTHCRFFEHGLRFVGKKQEAVLSGVWAGTAFEEQWGESKRMVDFYDMKKDIECLADFTWETGAHPALHPSQTAKLRLAGKTVGFCGALHPQLQQQLEIKVPLFLFEITLESLTHRKLPHYQAFSKFPSIRRDMALLIDESITVEALQTIIQKNASDYLQEICVFDVYQGKNIPKGKKSVALGLIFQAREKTLLENDIQDILQQLMAELQLTTGALLRE